MAEIFISIIAKIAEYTVHPILQHAQYLCCFNNFAEKLSNAKINLELTRDTTMERIKEATNKTEKIVPTVENWLKEVENVLKEIQGLEDKISKMSKSCFRRQCQYSLAKDIARKTEKMIQLNDNSKFEPFSMTTELPGMKYYSSKDFVLFESTKLAYNKLMEALKDKSVCMIGLIGLGGSGKTTLAKEVGKNAEELKRFEKVVFATVSQPLNIRSIQAQIADKLQLRLGEESDEGRAERLSLRLREGTTLVILDDVWEILDFEALGIPFIENNKGCQVLLTTRKRDVCTSRQCQRSSIIELNLLTSDEAWTLFRSCANIVDDSPDALKVVARKVVNECKGLPIAIVTVGSTLKGKTVEVWESALSRLEDSKPLVFPEGSKSPDTCLRLSYDNLTDESAKSFFLLCSIFPEDHEIDLEDLFRFGRRLGLTGTFGTMEKARKEFHLAVNILLDSCLLMYSSNKKVKMHDMVRDVALWTASKEGKAILASNVMDPGILVEDEIIKDKRAISLWDVKNCPLPKNDQLNCLTPTLEILLLHSRSLGFEVPSAYLERFKMLKILAFITDDYVYRSFGRLVFNLSLPQTMESLKNLHTLCLRCCRLGDISFLESLQALEILDLRGSHFDELPSGIVALKKLKLLDLYHCVFKKNNAYKVVEGCWQLEELYLYLIPSAGYFRHNVSFSGLQRYVIIQDHDSDALLFLDDSLEEHKPSRALGINGFSASVQSFLSLPISDLFQRAEYLYLSDLEGGYKNVIPSMDPKGMNQLIVLILTSCQEIECLFDKTAINNINVDMLQTQVVFSSLVELRLYSLDSLREVFPDPSWQCCLKNLQHLSIWFCKELNSISFPRNSKLCNLKEINIIDCPKLTSLFMSSVAQTLERLEVLRIIQCDELRHIIKQVEEGDVDHVSCPNDTSLMLPKLRHLEIEGCPSLKYILQEKEILWLVVTTFNQLRDQMFSPKLESVLRFHDLELSDNGIKGIFQFQIGEPESNRELVPFNMDLGTLHLRDLPELKFIWKAPPNFLRLHQLIEISLRRCPKLKAIFSPTILRSLPVLQVLYIRDCEELEQIFDSGDAQERKSQYNCSQQVCFPKLNSITVAKCNKLKCLFYNFVTGHFPDLTSVDIRVCSQLEKVFAFAHEADGDDGQEGIDKDGEQVILQNLRWITLRRLPKFKEIHRRFKLKDSVEQFIEDCPKYSPSLYLHPGT